MPDKGAAVVTPGSAAGAVHMKATEPAHLPHKHTTGRGALTDPSGSRASLSLAGASDVSSKVFVSLEQVFASSAQFQQVSRSY